MLQRVAPVGFSSGVRGSESEPAAATGHDVGASPSVGSTNATEIPGGRRRGSRLALGQNYAGPLRVDCRGRRKRSPGSRQDSRRGGRCPSHRRDRDRRLALPECDDGVVHGPGSTAASIPEARDDHLLLGNEVIEIEQGGRGGLTRAMPAHRRSVDPSRRVYGSRGRFGDPVRRAERSW